MVVSQRVLGTRLGKIARLLLDDLRAVAYTELEADYVADERGTFLRVTARIPAAGAGDSNPLVCQDILGAVYPLELKRCRCGKLPVMMSELVYAGKGGPGVDTWYVQCPCGLRTMGYAEEDDGKRKVAEMWNAQA